jgi:hypothetical protein
LEKRVENRVEKGREEKSREEKSREEKSREEKSREEKWENREEKEAKQESGCLCMQDLQLDGSPPRKPLRTTY